MEANKAAVRDFMERAFNQGDLTAIDEHLDPDGVDHQEPVGTDYRQHLRAVVTELRGAFPDLHFELLELVGEGEIVAFRSTMTGTHRGPFRGLPPTGRAISVAHMHFIRMMDGRSHDLWHVWDLAGLMRQLGVGPGADPAAGPRPDAGRA
jgi:steroid delta-isomerase-like uncharacterized protein